MQETTESLGTYVKRMRDEKNVSIEQVAYATRISLKMLRALEEDDHSALPAPTFVRGYLQAYAKYVRIDTQDLLLRYQHHLATAPDSKKGAIRSHYLYVRERYQEKRRLVLVIVLFVTMLSVAGTYFLLKAKRERNKQLTQQAEQILKTEPTDPKSAAVNPALAPAASVATPPAAPATLPATSAKTEEAAAKPATEPAKPATPPAPVKPEPPKVEAVKVEPNKPVTPPAPPATKPTDSQALNEPVPPAPADRPGDQKKTYNLLLRAEEDVWLRFQTDTDEVRDLTLRSGKAIQLRADKVIKIFSGNLAALKGTMNGSSMPSLVSGGSKAKSVVLPESEAGNHPLPLFPQFQPKPGAERATNNTNPSSAASPSNGESGASTPPNNAPQ